MSTVNFTTDECQLAYELNRSPRIMIVFGLHIAVSLIGIYAMWLYCRCESIRKGMALINGNLKSIVLAGFFYYFLGLSTPLLLYTYRLIIYAANLSPCFYIWNGNSCFISYSQFASACIVAYQIFHLSILLERLYATFINAKRRDKMYFGLILSVFLLIYPNANLFIKFYGTQPNQTFCSGALANTKALKTAAVNNIKSLLYHDVAITFADTLLLFYNGWRISKYHRKITTGYTLSHSFSLRESEISIKLIVPFSICHSISYITQFVFYLYYLSISNDMTLEMDTYWRELTNLVRTFGIAILQFLCLFAFHRLRRKQTDEWIRRENQTEQYFSMFQQMIS